MGAPSKNNFNIIIQSYYLKTCSLDLTETNDMQEDKN